ncbi:transcription factor DYT1 [Tanacetum coccineum]
MQHLTQYYLHSAMEFPNLYEDMSSMAEETRGSLGRVCRNKRQNYDDDNDNDNDPDEKFKSKNLSAERKRREKLKNRMLELGSFILFQLNKETAIDYMEEEMANGQSFEIIQIRPEEKMKKWGIESEVAVTHIDENKLWVKIVFEKKLGGFTKLIEALSILGIELVDISVTTTKGAVLVTSCIVGINGF